MTLGDIHVTARLAEACVFLVVCFWCFRNRAGRIHSCMHAGRPGRYPGHGGGTWGAAANGEGCHSQIVFRGLEPTVQLERGQKARGVELFHTSFRCIVLYPPFTISIFRHRYPPDLPVGSAISRLYIFRAGSVCMGTAIARTCLLSGICVVRLLHNTWYLVKHNGTYRIYSGINTDYMI